MFKKYAITVALLAATIFESCDKSGKDEIESIDLTKNQIDILFVSQTAGIQQIFAVQDTTFDEVWNASLAYGTHGVLDPSWCVDGRKFVFTDIAIMTSRGLPFHSNIYIRNMDNSTSDSADIASALRPVTYSRFWIDSIGAHGTVNIRPDWSLYTNQVVFISNRDSVFNVYLASITDSLTGDTLPTLLTNASDEIGMYCYPSFSPDGTKILYTSGKSGSDEIWVMNSDGTNKTRLTHNNATINFRPRFSPSADRISFFSNMWANGNDSLQVYTMDPNGANLDTVTTSGNNYDPSWSPDGNEIVFAKRGGSSSKPRSYIYIIGRNGLNERKLISGDNKAYYPAWRPLP
ncbi:TolB family protein [bacterium]|nr:TolB family protein [bacterium]